MKILAINGSPRMYGRTHTLINCVTQEAEKNGHEIEYVHLQGIDFKGCYDCDYCRGEGNKCHCQDDLNPIIERIIEADILIMGSPVYLGGLTGVFKSFLDRWCYFIQPGFTIRHVNGKKYIFVLTCGAPLETYPELPKYVDNWLTGFFKMEQIAFLAAGDQKDDDPEDPLSLSQEILEKAHSVGKNL